MMKTFCLALSLCLLGFAAVAGDVAYNTKYPAPIGNYNKLTLVSPTSSGITTPSCTASNVGLVYNDGFNNLVLCAKTSTGMPKLVPYNETCFNRFSIDRTFGGSPCPGTFTQAKSRTGAIVDHFLSNGTPVYSTVCCSTNSVVLPT